MALKFDRLPKTALALAAAALTLGGCYDRQQPPPVQGGLPPTMSDEMLLDGGVAAEAPPEQAASIAIIIEKVGAPKPVVVAGEAPAQIRALRALLECAPERVVTAIDPKALGAAKVVTSSQFLEARDLPEGVTAFGFPVRAMVYTDQVLTNSGFGSSREGSLAFTIGVPPAKMVEQIQMLFPDAKSTPMTDDGFQQTLGRFFRDEAAAMDLLRARYPNNDFATALPAFLLTDKAWRAQVRLEALGDKITLVNCGY